jgi:hypothetical protein
VPVAVIPTVPKLPTLALPVALKVVPAMFVAVKVFVPELNVNAEDPPKLSSLLY